MDTTVYPDKPLTGRRRPIVGEDVYLERPLLGVQHIFHPVTWLRRWPDAER